MTNRISKAVEEFYTSSTIAPLLDIKAEDMQNFCYQHKIKTKVFDDGNESKLFVSGKSLQDHLARSKVSDQANIALKWQALKQSIYSKNNKRIDRKPKEKQELPTCSEMPEGFVDSQEAARMLGFHKNSIVKCIKRGRLEAKKIKSKESACGFVYAVSIRSCEDYKNKSKEMPEGFVDSQEAARMLGFHENYISASCRKGKLEAKKIKYRHGFKYAVSIRSCEDWMEKEGHLRNAAKKVGTTYNKMLKVKKILEVGDKELIEKLKKEDISVDAAYRKIKTKEEDKMKQDNNSKLPSIDLYMLSRVIDLNTLALVYPGLRDWLAENRNATIREFIVDTIKQIDHLQKIANMENKNVITK